MADDILKKRIIEYNLYLVVFFIFELMRLIHVGEGSPQYIDIGDRTVSTLTITIIGTIINCVLVYCSHKRMLIPLILLSITMLFAGLAAPIVILSMLIRQEIELVMILAASFGIFFIYGGIRIIYIYLKFLRNCRKFVTCDRVEEQ